MIRDVTAVFSERFTKVFCTSFVQNDFKEEKFTS